MNIELLDTNFTGNGEVKNFSFFQIKWSIKAYLYLVNDSGKIHYEVFLRKKVNKCIDFERNIYSETEFKEIYPKSKDFGVWAWTFNDKQKAIDKFNLLNSQ